MIDDQVATVTRPSLETFCSIQGYAISGERRVTISIYRLSPFSKAGQARILQHDTGRFSRHHETPVLQLHTPVIPDLHPEMFSTYLTITVTHINMCFTVVAPCMFIVLSPLFVQLMHTNYYKIVKILK